MDALSEVLRAARLAGTAILDADFGAPWAVASGPSSALARGFIAPADPPAVLHLVTAGPCWLQLEDEAPLLIPAGHAALLPQGDAHRLGHATEGTSVALASLLSPPIAGELVPIVHGGKGQRTRVITMLACLDRRFADPLLGSLPRALLVDLRGSPAVANLVDALGFTLSGSKAPRTGGIASLARWSELVFIEAIRRHVESIAPGETGWLAGLGDRHVGRALALMHARPSDNWTVEKLARQVGLSRSPLAERFTTILGEPPITYLTHWRLKLAAQALLDSNAGIARLAHEAGYDSASAFSQAFKRAFGKPPSIWRKRAKRGR